MKLQRFFNQKVKAAMSRITEFDDEGNVVSRYETVGKTKTPKSVRTFIIPDIVVTVLKEWIAYCEENNISSRFVFPNTNTGEMRTYSSLRNLLMRFIKKHGLEDEKITLYTFRHPYVKHKLKKYFKKFYLLLPLYRIFLFFSFYMI